MSQRSRRRRNDGPHLVIIYWRDIPMQVNAQDGDQREQAVLPRRFQRAVDTAAMNAELTKADEYVLQMRRTTSACDADLAVAVRAAVDTIEAEYDRPRLKALAANGGLEP